MWGKMTQSILMNGYWCKLYLNFSVSCKNEGKKEAVCTTCTQYSAHQNSCYKHQLFVSNYMYMYNNMKRKHDF